MKSLSGLKKLILTNVLFLLLVGLISLWVILSLEYNHSYNMVKDSLFSATEKLADGEFFVVDEIAVANGKKCVEFCRLEIEFVKKVLYKLPCNAEKVRNREEFASFLLLPYMVY